MISATSLASLSKVERLGWANTYVRSSANANKYSFDPMLRAACCCWIVGYASLVVKLYVNGEYMLPCGAPSCVVCVLGKIIPFCVC